MDGLTIYLKYSKMSEDDDLSHDGPTLRQALEMASRIIDLGAAVLPQPLLQPEDEPPLGKSREGLAPVHNSKDTPPTRYASVLRREFNAVVVEHHMKWAPLCVSEPGPFDDETPSTRLGRYDFHHADAIVDWAIANDMKVKGHVLCWHGMYVCA
jgi:hypothetical protein